MKNSFYKPPLLPCSAEEHYPFKVNQVGKLPAPFGNKTRTFDAIHGSVRTTSWEFNGERTDLHDIWSLCWAIALRCVGITSPYLIHNPNPVAYIPGEIYSVDLLCPIQGTVRNKDKSLKSFQAWTSYIFHLLDSVFDWHSVFSGSSETRWEEGLDVLAPWIKPLIQEIGIGKNIQFSSRRRPNWFYYSDIDQGLVILRLSCSRMKALRVVLSSFDPQITTGNAAFCISANGIRNAIPYEIMDKGKRMLELAEKTAEPLAIIPIENACVFLGKKTLICLYANCGLESFELEKEYLFLKRQEENLVFYLDSTIEWAEQVDANLFEDLVTDIIEVETGVLSVKQVGSTNDRDGGRDIIIERLLPDQDNNSISPKVKKILVQVKTRKKSVGKADVTDIRDTIEHFDADGYFLVAFPRPTVPLFDHLDKLKSKKKHYIDWWDKRDLEDRLRRHPDIAHKYPTLLKFKD